MSKLLSAAFIFILGLTPALALDSTSSSVTLGDIPITLPASIGDFQRLDGRTSGFDALFSVLRPEANLHVLCTYGSSDDTATARFGKTSALQRYLIVESIPTTENLQVSPADFQKYKDNTRHDFPKGDTKTNHALWEKITGIASKNASTIDPDVTLKLGQSVPLGIYSETENSLSRSSFYTSKLTSNDGTLKNSVTVCSFTFVLVRGKILCVGAVSPDHSEQDLKWTQQMSLTVRDAILATNPPTASATSPSHLAVSSEQPFTNLTLVNLCGHVTLDIPSDLILQATGKRLIDPSPFLSDLQAMSLPEDQDATLLDLSTLTNDFNLTIKPVRAFQGLDTYATMSEADVFRKAAETIHSPVVLQEAKKTSFHGVPAVVIHTKVPQESPAPSFLVDTIILLMPDENICLRFTYREKNAKACQATIRSILDSIRPVTPESPDVPSPAPAITPPPIPAGSAPAIIGGQPINLPVIPHLVRFDGKSSALDAALDNINPKGSFQLLAIYGPQSDFDAIQRGEPVKDHLDRLIEITHDPDPSDDTENISPEEIPQNKAGLLDELSYLGHTSLHLDLEHIDTLSSAAARRSRLDALIGASRDATRAEIFSETDRSLCYSQLCRLPLGAKDRPADELDAVSTANTYVRGNLLYLSANAVYHSVQDLDWTRESALLLRDAILAANPDITPTSTPAPAP